MTGGVEVIDEEPAGSGPIRLLSANVNIPNNTPDQPDIQLRWYVVDRMNRDYTLFIHLRQADGTLVATGDGPPLSGWYPTSNWQRREIVVDERAFTMPDLAPGDYYIAVGWYDPDTGDRVTSESIIWTGRIVASN